MQFIAEIKSRILPITMLRVLVCIERCIYNRRRILRTLANANIPQKNANGAGDR